MGMSVGGYIEETSDCDYMLETLEIIKESIHNEQLMFESLFSLDYTSALNEADENIEKYNEILTEAQATAANGLKITLKRIINTFTVRMGKMQSKELKRLEKLLPALNLTVNDEKIQYLADKFKYTDGGKTGYENIYIDNYFALNIKDMDRAFEQMHSGKSKDVRDGIEFFLFKMYYSTNKDTETYLKNIKQAHVIIDYTAKEIKDLEKYYSFKIKQLSEDASLYSYNTTSYVGDINTIGITATKKPLTTVEDYKKLNENKDKLKMLRIVMPQTLTALFNINVATYKMLLFSLKYLTSGITVKEDADLLYESVCYEVDYDFGIL